jgi:biopolymer transport protein ExbB
MKRKFIAAAFLAVLIPSQSMAWWSPDWAQRRKIVLDTPAVTGLKEGVDRAPVLVRLHGANLDFTRLKPDGSDLRFVAADDKTPLNFHIERFDPAAELALVWVDVPKLTPGRANEIWVYYGSQSAKIVANPAATFDGEQALVLHLSDEAGAAVDATANANKVIATGTRPILDGLIAGGMGLTAASQLRVGPTAALTVQPGGQLTWSAWIKPDIAPAPVAADAVIYSKFGNAGDAAAERLSVGLRNGTPYVKLAGAQPLEALGKVALTPGTWAHLAVTAGDGNVILYVNGSEAGRFSAALPALGGADVIGAAAGVPGFAGSIDEIGRANVARSPSFVAVMAQSQGRLSSFAAVSTTAEDAEAEGHGYVKILFNALTPDAWAVIGLLALMAALSWVIMVSKGQMFGRTSSANRVFLGAYRKELAERDPLLVLSDSDLAAKAPNASLAHLFAIGQAELRQRLAQAVALGTPNLVAPQSVAAIRSSMDAAQVREEQRLNKWMVLLTIAISGGPFLGLLGTVVGVMITFAGVAAAGEVNITAIAPGIAAALLATVAGLVVAIPALFGYNYLTSRLEEISADNEIFVDEFEKRIAETYRPVAQPFAK